MELLPRAVIVGVFAPIAPGQLDRQRVNNLWNEISGRHEFRQLSFQGDGAHFSGEGPDDALVLQPPIVQVRSSARLGVSKPRGQELPRDRRIESGGETMTTLELDNRTDVTTASRSFDLTVADQSPPTTRLVGPDAYASERETLEIERNGEFHAAILVRLDDANGNLVDASDVLDD